jgi:hypothetical protein
MNQGFPAPQSSTEDELSTPSTAAVFHEGISAQIDRCFPYTFNLTFAFPLLNRSLLLINVASLFVSHSQLDLSCGGANFDHRCFTPRRPTPPHVR